MEATEDRLNRLFSGWTDAEVYNTWHLIRESGDTLTVGFDDFWREHVRRAFAPLNVGCSRCGSDNHTAERHDKLST